MELILNPELNPVEIVKSGKKGYNPPTMAQNLALKLGMYKRMSLPYDKMVVPVTLELPSTGDMFTLPVDPCVSVSHKNKIVSKQVAHYNPNIRGTIKEKWMMEDYTIKISGLLISDDKYCANDYVEKLRKYIEADENIRIICPYINDTYDIARLVIESADFAFTHGEDCQTFSLSCKSDDERYSLLLDK